MHFDTRYDDFNKMKHLAAFRFVIVKFVGRLTPGTVSMKWTTAWRWDHASFSLEIPTMARDRAGKYHGAQAPTGVGVH
jgi:hypothetical protein